MINWRGDLFVYPDAQLGRGEPVNSARVISQMVDIIMIRTYEHSTFNVCRAFRVPVINGLTTNIIHARFCDTFTVKSQHRKNRGWTGDPNNSNTWLQAAEIFDFKVHVSAPPGYSIDPAQIGLGDQSHYEEFEDPSEAVVNADLVTTDVWTSMGFEAETEQRKSDFADFCVDTEMMSLAKKNALFMHCLPAHRGEEVSAEVLEGPQSVVWDEAENRLHTQKALMEYLLLGELSS
jgi:ornithine carbamoyltransferase